MYSYCMILAEKNWGGEEGGGRRGGGELEFLGRKLSVPLPQDRTLIYIEFSSFLFIHADTNCFTVEPNGEM